MTITPASNTSTLFDSGKGSYIDIFRVQTEALRAMHDFLYQEGLIQLMPVILSPVTDSVGDASIMYNGQKLQLTKSMILHKQVAISTLDTRGIYIVSPNVRLERGPHSEKHLLEFSQLDIEVRDVSAKEFMSLIATGYRSKRCIRKGVHVTHRRHDDLRNHESEEYVC